MTVGNPLVDRPRTLKLHLILFYFLFWLPILQNYCNSPSESCTFFREPLLGNHEFLEWVAAIISATSSRQDSGKMTKTNLPPNQIVWPDYKLTVLNPEASTFYTFTVLPSLVLENWWKQKPQATNNLKLIWSVFTPQKLLRIGVPITPTVWPRVDH